MFVISDSDFQRDGSKWSKLGISKYKQLHCLGDNIVMFLLEDLFEIATQPIF